MKFTKQYQRSETQSKESEQTKASHWNRLSTTANFIWLIKWSQNIQKVPKTIRNPTKNSKILQNLTSCIRLASTSKIPHKRTNPTLWQHCRQASRIWNPKRHSALLSYGLIQSTADPYNYFQNEEKAIIIITISIDDGLVAGNNNKIINKTMAFLNKILNVLWTLSWTRHFTWSTQQNNFPVGTTVHRQLFFQIQHD